MKHSRKLIATGLITALVASTMTVSMAGTGSSDENEAELVSQATLSNEQAVAIALAQVPGKVAETEIEKEDGVLVWEVEVVNNQNEIYEITIDANTGEVLEKELDD